MNEKTYITQEEGKLLKFAENYQQCFEHESSQPKTMPEYTLVKAFVKLPEYDKLVTLEVLKFLYQFTFATHDQMVRLLEMKGIDPVGLDDNIQRMLGERMMNSFYLNQYSEINKAPEDAFVLYCMDFGAVALLNHFSNSDCITWFTTDAVRGSGLIQKYLSTVEFYLALAEVQGPALRYFKPTFDIAFGHREIRFSAAFEIMQGYSSHPFILESVRSFDLPLIWKEKIDNKLVHFACNSKHWGKYYSQEPVYLFLCENEQDALEAADLFYRRTDGQENFRLITDDQVKAGLTNAHFLKYIPSGEDNKVGTLQPVKASLLAGSST